MKDEKIKSIYERQNDREYNAMTKEELIKYHKKKTHDYAIVVIVLLIVIYAFAVSGLFITKTNEYKQVKTLGIEMCRENGYGKLADYEILSDRTSVMCETGNLVVMRT